jgi:hypothetical protein
MRLIIDSRDYLNPDEIISDLKEEGIQDWEIKIFDGGWSVMVRAHWYRKASGELPQQQSENLEHPGWFWYSVARFYGNPKHPNWYAFGGFSADKTLQYVCKKTAEILKTAIYEPSREAPLDFPKPKRDELVRQILELKLEYPENPKEYLPLPVAFYRDDSFYRQSVGNAFAQINEEFALEIDFEAWLHKREPTLQEIQLIQENLP